MKIQKGDNVLVISGKDKGAKGKVLEVFPNKDRIIVEGVNRVKKHIADSSNEKGASSGGIVTQEAAIHVSNVMMVDSSGKPTRVGYKFNDDGKKIRVSQRSGKEVSSDDK